MHQTRDHHGRLGAPTPAAILLLALCLLAGSAQALTDSATTASAPPGYETPIVTNAADQIAPAVHGSRVVWQDWRNNAIGDAMWDIYSYDTASHLELPEGASISGYGKYVPNDRDAAISARGIFWVWAGRSDADINNHIMGRTLGGDPVNVSVEQEGSYWNLLDLDADGDTLVGVVYNGDTYRLLEYWFADGHDGYIYLRQTENEIRSPKVSGHTIVWQEFDGNDWNVLAQGPGHGGTIALANNAASDEVSPTVSGTRVVWADNRSGDWDLWTADLSQQDPVGTPWLVAPGDQAAPSLSGDRLAWQDNRDGDWDVWLGSLAGGDGAPIASAAGDQQAPDVDGDRVVWQDRRNGNWDIYEFTVSPTTPAPVPTPQRLVITAPGTYQVTADGWDGTTTPVEIRSSDVVLDGGNHVLDGTGRTESCGVLIAGDGALSNVVVRNLRLTNWATGIRVANAAGSAVEGCEVEHNRVGVALGDTRSTAVRDCRVSANDDTGIGVSRSANATVSGNDVSRTGDGFQHLLSTTMDLSTFAVVVANSDGTAIARNDLGGDFGSLDIAGSTATRVTGNQITGHWVGIFSLSRGEGAAIYDNVFRNSRYTYGAPENTTWNATPSPGPNIVGGPTIGGNFWAKPDGTGFSETGPDANRDGFIDEPFIDTNWPGVSDYLPLAAWHGPAPGPKPYRPLSVPGRIEAEDYDLGGETIAYHDTTAGNTGGAYRADDVDIETAGGVTNVGWIRNGEYLTYTANVTTAGAYTLTARVASPTSGRTIAVSVDGTALATITVPNTGSFATFRDVTVPVTLAADTHTLRLTFSGDGQNIDWFAFGAGPTPTPTPEPDSPKPYRTLTVPGMVQAEDYDLGGEGVAYHDTTAGNSGGAYRNDGVDIETAASVTNVGWIRDGEWLTYTALVAQPGTYTMTARVASPNSGRTIAVSVDGRSAATIAVPNTGSFTTFRLVTVPVTLAGGGMHTLRLTFAGDSQNLDLFAFAPGGGTTPTSTPAPEPAGGASFTAAPTAAAHGSAVKFAVTPAAGKSIASAWWSFDAPVHLNTWNSRSVNPTFYYPSAGTFSPLVKLTYTDGTTETVQRTGYVRAT